ncbi:hypothetical protein LWI29_018952 [Acer saccharum]|uniref:Pectinesterase catalytic domain-containing protein n=1 Tax=Acer saccharum TaxID=4024 RepID=A0AA39W222_ACESA|nr:hypothetical protein LWI29_018952 [Acer saccharum]
MNIIYEEGIKLTSLFIKAGENATNPFLKMNIRTCIQEFDIGSYRVKTYGIHAFENGDYAEANNEIGFIVGGSSNCNDTGIKLFNKKVETSFNFSRNVLDLSIVIQNSYIGVRLPSGGQIVVTADGRFNEKSNTAIVIHNCSISPTPKLQGNPNVKSYLGRPWMNFSRTVIMQSYLDAFIDPQGWLKFDSSSDLVSLYYADYDNSGNGSFTSGRVNWPGYHIINNHDDVQSFTVEKFVNGSEWLPKLGVPFIPGLIG